jgi:hypothetical protein
VAVEEVRWEREGYQTADNCTFSYGEGMFITAWGQFFMYNRIISADKIVQFVSDKMSYITLNGSWCDIILLNMHAPNEDKDDVIKEELEEVFDQSPVYHT